MRFNESNNASEQEINVGLFKEKIINSSISMEVVKYGEKLTTKYNDKLDKELQTFKEELSLLFEQHLGTKLQLYKEKLMLSDENNDVCYALFQDELTSLENDFVHDGLEAYELALVDENALQIKEKLVYFESILREEANFTLKGGERKGGLSDLFFFIGKNCSIKIFFMLEYFWRYIHLNKSY